MGFVRAFVAIELQQEIKQAVRSVSARLLSRLEGLPIKFVSAAHIHLTLLFLGDIPQSAVPVIMKSLGAISGVFGPFDLRVKGAGVFPDYKKPRVIWIGLDESEAEQLMVLRKLQTHIRAAIVRAGLNVEDQIFNPHLTIGRVKQNSPQADLNKIGEVVKSEKIGDVGVLHVNQFHLFRSELTPSGPVYSNLATFGLGNQTR